MRNAILTIDDSPSDHTQEFANYLSDKSIHAIFFCIGENIENNIEFAESILKEGHEIGNHSYSHRNFNELSLIECIDEVTKTETIINNLYSKCGIQRQHKFFRFPYGAKGDLHKTDIQEYLKYCGFDNINDIININYDWYYKNNLDDDVDVFWTFDCEDYKISSKKHEFTINDVKNHINAHEQIYGGSLAAGEGDEIILMHDNNDTHILIPEYYKTIIMNIEDQKIVFKNTIKKERSNKR